MKRAIKLERQLKRDIEKDLEAKHISLIIGARQTGKTTIFKADIIRNALINNYSPIGTRTDKGELFENYVYLMLKDKYGQDNLRFWRTQDGKEVDFIAKSDTGKTYAFEAKFDPSNYTASKYRSFESAYPDIPLKCIGPDDALNYS